MVYNSKEKLKKWQDEHKEQTNQKKKEYHELNKEADNKRSLKWYHENKERIREKHNENKKKSDQKLADTIMNHYGGNPPKCACCGETERSFLELDHINGYGTQQRKQIGTGYTLFRWIIKNDFPEEYQVLCSNCNLSKLRNKGKCIHEIKKLNK